MYKSLSDYKINVDGYQGFHVFICCFTHMLKFHSCGISEKKLMNK